MSRDEIGQYKRMDGRPDTHEEEWIKQQGYIAKMNLASNMGLRDYFAAKAMQGLLADSSVGMYPNDYAELAYKIADAMLEARSKT